MKVDGDNGQQHYDVTNHTMYHHPVTVTAHCSVIRHFSVNYCQAVCHIMSCRRHYLGWKEGIISVTWAVYACISSCLIPLCGGSRFIQNTDTQNRCKRLIFQKHLTVTEMNFMVARCISNIKHIIVQLMHTNYKILRLLK